MHANGVDLPGTRVAFLVQRIGPYHHARLRALAADPKLRVQALEFRPQDAVYSWDPVTDSGGYGRSRVPTPGSMGSALDEARPEVVVCVGYADPEIHRAAAWSLRHGVPLVTCSDSTFDDEPRSWVKEALKRLVVSAFDAALVAGSRSNDYLGTLGMRGDALFRPWDVVDNEHFKNGAEAVRRTPSEARSRLGLPGRYFLCSARFVPKKNLGALVDAYARYVALAGESAWTLVLSGSGPLEGALREQVAAAGLGARVYFPGFLQYPDLPTLYGLAGALILPSVSDQWGLVVNEAMAAGLPVVVSSRCGCAPDLVRSGENGFTFEPDDPEALARIMARMAGLETVKLAAMGRRSGEIIAEFTPEAFASGLKAAIECARARSPGRRKLAARAAVGALSARPSR
jgi:glycosyltransferase involved in cell wall biosynthesis